MQGMVGRFAYDAGRERWDVVDGDGVELQELHCGDVLTVHEADPDGMDWMAGRVELDGWGYWYMVMEDGKERDDFELLDVLL